MADKQTSFGQFDTPTRNKLGLPTGKRAKPRSASKPSSTPKPKKPKARKAAERVTGGAMARLKSGELASRAPLKALHNALGIKPKR